jgi:putative transposase
MNMKRNVNDVKSMNEKLEKNTFPLYTCSHINNTTQEEKCMNHCTKMIQETKQFIQVLQTHPEQLFTVLRSHITLTVGAFLTYLMNQELTDFLGREKYEHTSTSSTSTPTNYRNGSYQRNYAIKQVGSVSVSVPRDRLGLYQTKVITRYQRLENELRQDICLLYLSGISTRILSLLSKRLLGRSISPTEVSRCHKELTKAVEQWRTRELSNEIYQYLFLDGVTFLMRTKHSIERIPVLVVIGVTEEGERKVLLLQAGDKESASTWRQCIKDLKQRGLQGDKITLGIMDGLPGLEKVFCEEFHNAKVQRCQVHVTRNILAKVPKKHKPAVVDALRSIFYASSKEKAKEFLQAFQSQWKGTLPSATKCLENNFTACTTYYHFPEEEWISLRTTNMIERLNKEFKRRTKPMEMVAGETACYQLLAFISLKMELHWKSNRFGTIKKHLPFFQNLDREEK